MFLLQTVRVHRLRESVQGRGQLQTAPPRSLGRAAPPVSCLCPVLHRLKEPQATPRDPAPLGAGHRGGGGGAGGGGGIHRARTRGTIHA